MSYKNILSKQEVLNNLDRLKTNIDEAKKMITNGDIEEPELLIGLMADLYEGAYLPDDRHLGVIQDVWGALEDANISITID